MNPQNECNGDNISLHKVMTTMYTIQVPSLVNECNQKPPFQMPIHHWVRADLRSVNGFLATGDTSFCGSERFEECVHQDIGKLRMKSKMITYSSSVGSGRADRLCLVDVHVELCGKISIP